MKKGTRTLEIIHSFLLLSMLYDLIIQMVKPGNPQMIYKNILLLPVAAALSVACERVKNFWQFLFISLLTVLGVYYGGGREIYLPLCGIFAAASYFHARAKKEKCWLEAPAYPWLLGYLVLYIVGDYLKNDYMKIYLSVKAAIYFLIYNFHTNLVALNQFVSTHKNLERLPVKRLGKINQGMMWIFNGTVAAAMVAAPFLGIDGMIRKIGSSLKTLLLWILQFLFRNGGGQEEAEMMEQGGAAMLPPVQQGETPLLVEIIYRIFNVLGWILGVGLILLLLWILVKRLYFLYQNFNVRTEENGDRVERLTIPFVSEKKKKLSRESKEHLFWDTSPDARIRKHYKKRVKQAWGKEIPYWYTPSQLEEELTMEEEERERFHVLYEKARYGKKECSRNELEEMLKIKG